MLIFHLVTVICGNMIPKLESNSAKTWVSLIFNIGSFGMSPYLQGVNCFGDTPWKKHFGVIMAVAWGLFFESINAPYIYTKMLKSYPMKKFL